MAFRISLRYLGIFVPVILITIIYSDMAIAQYGGEKIKSTDIIVGSGEEAVRHSKISVLYTGWLKNGKKFDSNQNKNKPFNFTLGGGQVIPGWDMGVVGMRVGGKRTLIIPPEMAYGKRGAGPIPANATLKFEIDLLAVTPPGYSNLDNLSLRNLLKRGVKIVDLRRPDEWKKTGIIEGSKVITAFEGAGNFIRKFPKQFQEFAGPEEEIILICRRGNRTSIIANMLVEQGGYTRVYNVTDGIVKWTKEGNPVVKY